MKTILVKAVCLIISMLWAGNGLAKEGQPVTVLLDWVPNVQFAGILVAKERGWYKEAGIELTIRSWNDDTNSIRGWEDGFVSTMNEVTDGKAQFGIEDGSAIIDARAKGKPVKAIAAIFQKSPLGLISKKEQKIRTPDQLFRKRIGISSPKTELMTRLVLKNNLNDVSLVQTKGDIRFLINNQVDVFAGYMNNEPLLIKGEGYEVSVIPGFRYGYDFYSGVCFTSEKMIRDNPELVRTFVSVTQRGWKEAFDSPASTAVLVVEKFFQGNSVSQQAESLKVFKQLATTGIGDNPIGYMEKGYWEKGIEILFGFGDIEKKIPANEMFTNEFLKK